VTAHDEASVRDALKGPRFTAVIIGRSFTLEQQDYFARIICDEQGHTPILKLDASMLSPHVLVSFIKQLAP
jgi:hypothetical protein